MNRGITVGTSVDPSTTLLTIADLSRVWVLAEVPEADITGHSRRHAPRSSTSRRQAVSRSRRASTSSIRRSPTARARCGSASRRPIPAARCRPGLYGTAAFESAGQPVITVPRDAVVDTGVQQHVFVATGDRFEPRAVTLGVQLADRVEVRSGLDGRRADRRRGRVPARFGEPAARHRRRRRAQPRRTGDASARRRTARRTPAEPAAGIDPHAGHRE